MEGIAQNIKVYDKRCIGSLKFKKDIMIAFMIEDNPEIHDIFLTTEQAKDLVARINKRLEENEQY